VSAARAAAPVALALFALAAACRAPADPRALQPLRLFAQQHVSGAPLYLAESEGDFRAAGFAVEWIRTGSSRDLLPSLLEGGVDVIASNLSPVFLNAAAQGGRLRIVADKGHLAREGCNYLSFLTRPELLRDGRLAPPEGGKLRVSYRRGSLYEMLFDRALDASGLSREATELHFLSGEVEDQALLAGGIDVASSSGATMQALLDSGRAAVWQRAQDLLPDGQAYVVLFGPSLLDRDPAAGERFMTAYLRGVRRYNQGKTRRNVELLATALDTPAAEIERACWVAIRDDGKIDVATIDALIDWARANGRLDAPLAAADVWEPRFVEQAARALDEGPAPAGAGKGDGA
jgi:NitT/TauT family transport system substrate-binding protein